MTRQLDYQGYVSAQDPRTQPPVTAPIRQLQNEGNTTPATLPMGDNVQSPENSFGLALMALLKQHQSLGTAPLVKQQLNLSDTQAQAGTNAALSPDLKGYSPSTILGAHNDAQVPYNPLIQGSGNDQQTLSEQIKGLGSGLTAAQSFLKTNIDAKNKSRDDARKLIQDSFTSFGGGAFDKLTPKDQQDLEKAAGLPAGYLHGTGTTIKERELQMKQEQKALTNGLTQQQISTTVNQIAQTFDNEQLVKDFNTANTGVNYIKSLGSTPTDDIARIYQFAKIMDPSSAVREGEYKTVQEYSTALLQRYGLNAKRVFKNDGFLTDEARTFLSGTLQKRLDAQRTQYKALEKQYQDRIAKAQKGEMNSITNYDSANFAETKVINGRTYQKVDGGWKLQ